MKQVVIENPVLNSPFREPTRHFRFADEGIKNEIADGRGFPLVEVKEHGLNPCLEMNI